MLAAKRAPHASSTTAITSTARMIVINVDWARAAVTRPQDFRHTASRKQGLMFFNGESVNVGLPTRAVLFLSVVFNHIGPSSRFDLWPCAVFSPISLPLRIYLRFDLRSGKVFSLPRPYPRLVLWARIVFSAPRLYPRLDLWSRAVLSLPRLHPRLALFWRHRIPTAHLSTSSVLNLKTRAPAFSTVCVLSANS